MADDPCATAAKPTQRWLMVYHPAGRRSRVAHYVLTPNGTPGDGVGWHTACGVLWADGVRTGRNGWRFANPEGLRNCKACSRKVTADAV